MKSLPPLSSNSTTDQKTRQLKRYMAKHTADAMMEDESKQGTVATLTTQGSDEVSFERSYSRQNITSTPVASRAYLGGFKMPGSTRSSFSSATTSTATSSIPSARSSVSDGSSARSSITSALSLPQGLWQLEPDTATTMLTQSTTGRKKDKKKKKKSEKKSKKKSEKKRKKERKATRSPTRSTVSGTTASSGASSEENAADEEEEDVLTAQDKAVVENLCNIFSETLSTAESKRSFLRLLKESSARSNALSAHSAPTVKAGNDNAAVEAQQQGVCDSPYSQLQSPASSVCGELPSETNSGILNLQQLFPKLEQASSVAGTDVNPPSQAGEMETPEPPQQQPAQSLPPAVAAMVQDGSQPEAGAAAATMDPTAASAEQLFLALPSQFRDYLFQLHKQESTMDTNAPPVHEIMGRSSSDAMSVVSEVSGLTSAFVQRFGDDFDEESDSDSENGADSNSNQDAWSSSRDKDSSTMEKERRKSGQNQFVQFIPPPPVGDADTVGPQSIGASASSRAPRRSSLYKGKPPSEMSASEKLEASARSLKQGSVWFSTVSIREYNTVPSDNPACSDGPPIELGWQFSPDDMIFDVDEYTQQQRPRREELLLSKKTREAMLLRLGYTQDCINKSVRRLNRQKSQRRRTLHNLGAQNVEYAMERVGRRFKSLLTNSPEDGGDIPDAA